jgi:hypothetical protein
MDTNTLKAVEALANKLGTTAEYLWGVLIKQAQVEFIIGIILSVLMLVLLVTGFKLLKWALGRDSDGIKRLDYMNSDQENKAIACLIAGGFFLLVSVIALPIFIIDTISIGLNPEYWALSQILNAGK